MCMKPSDCPCPGRATGGEWLVLLALLHNGSHMLSRSELQREIVQPVGAQLPNLDDEIANLHAVGLVNVAGELVGASRAARFMDELLGSSV